MSRSVRLSSSVTMLIATPFLPKRPPLPILGGGGGVMKIREWKWTGLLWDIIQLCYAGQNLQQIGLKAIPNEVLISALGGSWGTKMKLWNTIRHWQRCRNVGQGSPVNVVLSVGGQVIVYDQRDLLYINASGLQERRGQFAWSNGSPTRCTQMFSKGFWCQLALH